MADSNQNIVSFRLTGTLSVSWTTVSVSSDSLRWTAIDVANASITLKNEQWTVFELIKATITGGVLTTSKRWITEDQTLTEDSSLKREWRPWTVWFITTFASDNVDKEETWIQANNTKIQFGWTSAYIYTTDNWTNLKIKDWSNTEQTLTELTTWAGTDHKVAASNVDTTANYLDNKITAWDWLSKTITNPAWNEVLDLDIDLTDTTIFSATKVAWKVPLLNASWTVNTLINTQADWKSSTTELWLVELATDAEFLTGTDQERYTNAKQWAMTVFADDLVIASSDAVVDLSAIWTYTKVKEALIKVAWTYRIKFTVIWNGSWTSYGKVYKNWSALWVEQLTNATINYSADFVLAKDDLIQIYWYSTWTWTRTISLFKVWWTPFPTIAIPTVNL